jgi:thiamine-phosphate pyrophosphorylase
MTPALPLRGLYAITAQQPDDEAMLAAVAAAIEGGSAVIQYRDKWREEAAKLALAQRLRALCHARGVPLIINDDIALAAQAQAAGVHLGRDDAGVAEARRVLGPAAIIGVSCYNSLELARQAHALGASYAAFGRFFASNSKPLATPAALDTLQRAKAELAIPLAAIGGVTPANGAALLAAGADFLCAIEGVFGQPDVRQAARDYAALFSAGTVIQHPT